MNSIKANATLIFCFLALSLSSQAQSLPEADEKALNQTKQILADPVALHEATKNDPKAQAALKQAELIFGANNPQAMQLASKIFERMIRESGGQIDSVSGQLESGKRNPAQFLNSLTAEERQMIRSLATQLQKNPGRR